MWNEKEKSPFIEFIIWVIVIAGVVQTSLVLLEPYSIMYANEGKVTLGYVIYAILGIFLDTPCPLIATFIVLKRHKKNYTVKIFCKEIFHTENVKKTVLITGVFCFAALVVALLFGIRTSNAWYLAIPAFPLMILGGGVEEVGWRGFLQPEVEKRFPFPVATIFVAVIWYSWHLTLWLEPTSNHYNDSLIGFAINIFVWSFVAAAIYKATKSVIACVIYHTFLKYDRSSI